MNKTNIKLYATKEQAQIVHSLATLYKITTGEVQRGDQTVFWDWDWPFRPRVSFAFENDRSYEHGNSGWRIFKADQFDAGLAAITEQLVGYRPVSAPLVIADHEVMNKTNISIKLYLKTSDLPTLTKITDVFGIRKQVKNLYESPVITAYLHYYRGFYNLLYSFHDDDSYERAGKPDLNWEVFPLDKFSAGLGRITEILSGFTQPLLVGDYTVEFRSNGDVQVGCTTVDSELFEKIAARRAGAMSS